MFYKPHILVTNDDGLYAPGIRHLWNALHEVADVTVVAPMMEQSGAALSITVNHPLRIEEREWTNQHKVLAVNGTPADSVKAGIHMMSNQGKRPDFVFSGINRGSNSGNNILYSGTIGAVIEAALRGIPGAAFSYAGNDAVDYTWMESPVRSILRFLIDHPLSKGSLLNVNFPKVENQEPKGFKLVQQGANYFIDDLLYRQDHHGRGYYWLGCRQTQEEEKEESDNILLEQGYVTAVPIHVGQLTDFTHLKENSHFFEQYFHQL